MLFQVRIQIITVFIGFNWNQALYMTKLIKWFMSDICQVYHDSNENKLLFNQVLQGIVRLNKKKEGCFVKK